MPAHPRIAADSGSIDAIDPKVRIGSNAIESVAASRPERSYRNILLATMFIGGDVSNDAGRCLDGYAALKNYTSLGGQLTVFALPGS